MQAELAETSDLVREQDYLSAPEPQATSVLSLLARPFWWTLSTVVGSSTKIDYGESADQKEWTRRQGAYVVPDLVEVSGADAFYRESRPRSLFIAASYTDLFVL